jgi:hypothetical protein
MSSNPNMTTKCSLQTQKIVPKEIQFANDMYDCQIQVEENTTVI